MPLKLRIASALAALTLLAGCQPESPDSPGTPVTTPPSVVATTSAPVPTVSATPEAVPTTAVPPAAPTVAAPAAGTGAGNGGGAAACAADEYRNVDGVCVHRPVPANQPPAGATAQCNDGTYSFSTHHSGTCSHHGGVRRWL